MKRTLSTVTALILTISIMLNFAACTKNQTTEKPDITDITDTEVIEDIIPITDLSSYDLMSTVRAKDVTPVSDLTSSSQVLTDFAVRLLKECEASGDNTLISPLSVLCALSMTANGARGETLEEMENVLGMSIDELNEYIYSYMSILSESEDCKLSLANSIWFNDHERFTVNEAFLQTNADYYNADIYRLPFNASTADAVNDWVDDKTGEMIKNILDEIPADAIMYLVNALAFDAVWNEMYEDFQVRDGKFTTEDGDTLDVELMHSEENIYLEDENTTGFAKYYKDGKYAFAALLPDEGISISDYVASLTGERLHSILTNSQSTAVDAAIPKFEDEFDIEMSAVLTAMGMPAAFSTSADFEGLGSSENGPIYISRVVHKTYIAVNESGTRAGAATIVEAVDGCAPVLEETKQVYLDRPFVYMLIDTETNIPFFIGTMMNP